MLFLSNSSKLFLSSLKLSFISLFLKLQKSVSSKFTRIYANTSTNSINQLFYQRILKSSQPHYKQNNVWMKYACFSLSVYLHSNLRKQNRRKTITNLHLTSYKIQFFAWIARTKKHSNQNFSPVKYLKYFIEYLYTYIHSCITYWQNIIMEELQNEYIFYQEQVTRNESILFYFIQFFEDI